MLVTLIGYRGTGKTTVARLLAQQWRTDWTDSDQVIEQRAKLTIREIFEQQGEIGFRDWEEKVIAEVTAQAAGVLAVGGGAVLRPQNRQAIGQGTVVWLTARPDTILERVSADPTTKARRPALTTAGGLQEIETLLAQRQPLYQDCADHTVATDGKTAEQVVAEIGERLGSRE